MAVIRFCNKEIEMRIILLAAAALSITASYLLGFSSGSIEPVQRNIIYIHVPASITALCCFCVLFISSCAYLKNRKIIFDKISHAAAKTAMLFTVVLNITGVIFSHAEWSVWWTASPRLISSAVLLFLCAAYIILRANLTEDKKPVICAVFGIIAFIDVPIVFAASRLMRDIHRPSVSFQNNCQTAAFTLAVLGTIALAAFLIWIQTDILILKEKQELEK